MNLNETAKKTNTLLQPPTLKVEKLRLRLVDALRGRGRRVCFVNHACEFVLANEREEDVATDRDGHGHAAARKPRRATTATWTRLHGETEETGSLKARLISSCKRTMTTTTQAALTTLEYSAR